jgi:hypothetical protein
VTCTTPFGLWTFHLRSAFVAVLPVFDLVLTPAERSLLQALDALGVRYLIVGMAAALIEGAPGTTQDLDLWFGPIDADRLREAARRAGGLYTAGFGMQPPTVEGEGLDRVDVVLTASGPESFDQEFQGAREYEVDGVRVRVLPLERVIVSKRAARRAKDSAQIPILEATLAARRARAADTEGA